MKKRTVVWFYIFSLFLFPIFLIFFTYSFGFPHPFILHRWITFVLLFFLIPFHEFIHYIAIRYKNPLISSSFFWGPLGTPMVQIKGTLSIWDRIIFLLAPVVFISLFCWILCFIFPNFTVTWILLATTNATCSTSDFSRFLNLRKTRS